MYAKRETPHFTERVVHRHDGRTRRITRRIRDDQLSRQGDEVSRKKKKDLTDLALIAGGLAGVWWIINKSTGGVPVSPNSTVVPLASIGYPAPPARPRVRNLLASYPVKTRQNVSYRLINQP